MAKADNKVLIANLKKYHFWGLFAAAVLTVLAVWWLSTDALGAKYTERTKKLDAAFQDMQKISTEPNHPTQAVIEQIRNVDAEAAKKVFSAWQYLYVEQQRKNPWPAELGNEFLQEVANLKPREELSSNSREIYQNFIKQHFPSLLEIVSVRHEVAPPPGAAPPPAAAAGAATGDERPREMAGLVDWDSEDIEKMRKRFEWATVPSTEQIRLAQEDLWVYEALLRIIQDTNEGVAENQADNAHVKRIETLEIGQDAAAAWGKLLAADQKFVPPPPGSEGGAGSMESPAGAGPGGGEEPGGEDLVTRKLRDKRYVNETGKPLAAGEPPPFPELNLMPIHMRLTVNQKYIPLLIANCANRNMPVEVRQFRCGVATGEAVRAAASDKAASDSAAAAGGDSGTAHSKENVTLDVPVEIFGIISIYKLPQGGPATETAAAPGSAPPGPAAPGAPAPGPAAATPPVKK